MVSIPLKPTLALMKSSFIIIVEGREEDDLSTDLTRGTTDESEDNLGVEEEGTSD
jgi:hypothetical protein